MLHPSVTPDINNLAVAWSDRSLVIPARMAAILVVIAPIFSERAREKVGTGLLSYLPRVIPGEKGGNYQLSDIAGKITIRQGQGVSGVGQGFVIAIFEHVETLVAHPDLGRVVPEFDQDHLRELIHPPFRIVYLREHRSIQIIRIWRSERVLALPDTDSLQRVVF